MLEGRFQVGTHQSINAEESTNAAFSDKEEGRGSWSWAGENVRNWTGAIGNAILINNSFSNSTTNVTVETDVNLNVFCTSKGKYNRARHAAFVEGNEQYHGNDDYKYYIVLRRGWLRAALISFAEDVYGFPCSSRDGPVSYGDREIRESLREKSKDWGPAFIMQQRMGAAFKKPPAFAIEEEYRLLVWPEKPGVKVRKLGHAEVNDRIAAAFREAIVEHGRL